MEPVYLEEDFRRLERPDQPTQLLPGTGIEIVRARAHGEPPRHVLFDFDGTLSLIRSGWIDVMAPMMVEVLAATPTDESPAALDAVVRDFVTELNGKQTIYQMIRLAEEVRRRGGAPDEPLAYKKRYHDLLMQRIAERREGLRAGTILPDTMLVSHARPLLDELCRRGTTLYLASGTDEHYVLEEVRLLGLEDYFGPRVYGAKDDYRAFSKAMIIERILLENRVAGAALLGFGDGYVEIQNVKAAGGGAVAVASDEVHRSGRPDAWKRDRLIGAGADAVIPDYRDYRVLLDYLWGS